MAYSKEVREFVAKRVEELPGTWEEKRLSLVAEVKEKFGEILTVETGEGLRKNVEYWERKMRSELDGAKAAANSLASKAKEISDSIDSKKKYEIVDGNYHIRTRRGTYTITKDEADEIFLDFSKHGRDLSGEEIRIKYQLKPEAWIAIKNALGLYKASHVVSPNTIETADEVELSEIVERAVGAHIDRVKEKMVRTHAVLFETEAKKAMRTLSNVEYFLDNLRTFIEGWEPRRVTFETSAPANSDWKHYFISDIHIGKLDTEGVLRRLDAVKRDIIASPEGTAIITIGGDLGETFAQDGNHPGMLAYGTEERWGRGFDLMLNIAKAFEDFLIDIRKSGKAVKVNGITGNHGRMTGKKEDDIMRTAELAIYELIKRAVSLTDIELKYAKESVTVVDADLIRFVMIHGDAPLGNQNPEKLLFPYQVPGKHLIAVTGDRHTLQMREGFGYTYVRSPALAGKGQYDTSMNLHSEPGYLVFSPNEYGTVDITVKRLK